jgi:hypothetical protein
MPRRTTILTTAIILQFNTRVTTTIHRQAEGLSGPVRPLSSMLVIYIFTANNMRDRAVWRLRNRSLNLLAGSQLLPSDWKYGRRPKGSRQVPTTTATIRQRQALASTLPRHNGWQVNGHGAKSVSEHWADV